MPCTPKCPPRRVAKGRGFLNFMKDYRKRVCGLSATETKRRGAKAWQRLSCLKREAYRTKRPRKSRRRPCPKPCPPVRRRSCSRPRKRRPVCCRPKSPPRRPPCCAPCRPPSRPPCRPPCCAPRRPPCRPPCCAPRRPPRRPPCCAPRRPPCRPPCCAPSCPPPRPPSRPPCSPPSSRPPKMSSSTEAAYLNFLRCYRKKHCEMTAITALREAARRWCKMTHSEKDRYK